MKKQEEERKTEKKETLDAKQSGNSPVILRKPKKLGTSEALKVLVAEKRILPACESSSACSRIEQ